MKDNACRWLHRLLPAACCLLATCCLLFAGCDDSEPGDCSDGRCPLDREQSQLPSPIPCPLTYADIPPAIREHNYGGGSCTWASMETMFRWHGLDAEADLWRKTYTGGANWYDVARECDHRGLRYAYTDCGDERFLDWCARTRRPAMIHWDACHSINFCGYKAVGSGQWRGGDREQGTGNSLRFCPLSPIPCSLSPIPCSLPGRLPAADGPLAVLIDNNAPGREIVMPRQEFLARWRASFGGGVALAIVEPPPPLEPVVSCQ
jgi:hypothetical protein